LGGSVTGGGVVLQVIAGRAFWHRLAGALSPIVLLGLSTTFSSAQTTIGFGGTLDPLFQGVLARPANLANTLQYASSSQTDGDIESAISAYEQLLFYNPKLSQTRFQLGILYFQLGSYAMARGYLQTALEMADITPDLQRKAEDLLELANKKLQADQFTGFAQTGLRWQSNATQGPGPQTALATGGTFNNRFVAQGDWNWFGTFGLNYVHDFQSQSGTTFEASVLGYDAQQFTVHQVDIGLLEIRAGPRFALTPGNVNGVTIKPYVIATGALLADTAYMAGIGGGLTVHATAGHVSLDPYAEYVQQSFRNSTFYPLASGMTGPLQTYGIQAAGPVVSGLSWQSRVGYAHANDQFAYDAYNSFIADLWLPWSFSFLGSTRPWTVIPSGGVTTWNYAAADPSVNPLIAANVTEWRASLGLEIPVWQKVVLASLVQYRSDQSNVAAFVMHDLSVTAGPSIRF
jgi:tetratricopeptide (TPR) repeat protein